MDAAPRPNRRRPLRRRYAAKKTRKTITVSLAALEGAACMNNTFCLAIFMALVFFKGLAWKFTAETITILVVECRTLRRLAPAHPAPCPAATPAVDRPPLTSAVVRVDGVTQSLPSSPRCQRSACGTLSCCSPSSPRPSPSSQCSRVLDSTEWLAAGDVEPRHLVAPRPPPPSCAVKCALCVCRQWLCSCVVFGRHVGRTTFSLIVPVSR